METVSILVAAYGAILATYLGYLTYRRERHRLRVRLMFSVGEGPPQLAVTVVNAGSRPVTVTSGQFTFDDGGIVGIGGPAARRLPAKLEDGDMLVLDVPIEWIPEAATGYSIEDSTGRPHVTALTPDFHEQLGLLRDMIRAGS